jgi:hypothetical protein
MRREEKQSKWPRMCGECNRCGDFGIAHKNLSRKSLKVMRSSAVLGVTGEYNTKTNLKNKERYKPAHCRPGQALRVPGR